jgi:protein gp37
MADVFEEAAPEREQARLWKLIEATPHLRWLLLTKRPERIRELVPPSWLAVPRANVWYGTSVESAAYAERVRELRKVPGVVHFLSVEPLLGPIPRLPLVGIDWVIVGGESGSSARPMEEAWVLAVRDRCLRRGVPFFFKQWGGRNKKAAGRTLAGQLHDALPTAP